MVKHVVFFKIREEFTDSKDFACQDIIDVLKELPDKIDIIRGYELGINFAEKETAYDLCLISVFDSEEDLDKYRVHPEHVAAVEKIRRYIDKTAFVDFKIS